MKTVKVILVYSAILIFCSLAINNVSAKVLSRNRIEINLSDMITDSKVVFEKSYGGIIGLDIRYLHQVKPHLLLGGLFEHSRFEMDDAEVIKAAPVTRHTKCNISGGAIVGGVEYPLNKIISSTFQIGVGYSWISIKNEQNNFSYKESGPLLRPSFSIQFSYFDVGLSLSIAYPIIFENFADDVGLDDSTTRWWNFSGGIVYSF